MNEYGVERLPRCSFDAHSGYSISRVSCEREAFKLASVLRQYLQRAMSRCILGNGAPYCWPESSSLSGSGQCELFGKQSEGNFRNNNLIGGFEAHCGTCTSRDGE